MLRSVLASLLEQGETSASKELDEIFDSFDTEQSGHLPIKEMKAALRSLYDAGKQVGKRSVQVEKRLAAFKLAAREAQDALQCAAASGDQDSIVMLLEAGFRPHLENTRRTFRLRILITLGTVIAVAVPLTMHTRAALANRELRSDVSTAIAEWDARARISELRTSIDDGTAVVSVLVAGPGSPEEVWRLAQALHDDVNRPLELELRYSQILEFRVDVE